MQPPKYFYTIKELREAVTPMSKLDLKSVEDEKLSDDDLKRHRVGGRLVTRREIIRSKKCTPLFPLYALRLTLLHHSHQSARRPVLQHGILRNCGCHAHD